MSLALCVFLEWNGKSLITCQKHCYESSSKNQMGNGKVKDDLLTCKKSSYVLLAHFTSHFNYFVFLNMDTKSTLNNSQSTWPLWKISEIPGAIRVKLDLQLLKIFSSFSMISARLPKWKKKKKKINGNLVLLVLGEEVGTVQLTISFQTFLFCMLTYSK